MLTKRQMREAIEQGRSVLYKGKLITNLADLAKVGGTAEEKEAEIKALKSRLAELENAGEEVAAIDGKTLKESNDDSENEPSDDEKAKDLMKNTRAELADMAKEAGIEVAESDTKAEIVEKILVKGE